MNKIVLEAVTGSRAYGLNHEDSDTDKMGVFVAPTEEIAGLFWGRHDESWSDAGPTGDDNTYHEIGKFLRLTLQSNPTLIELYFMNDYAILDEVGQGIVNLRDDILHTHGIRSAYYGYAVSQWSRVLADYPNFKPKMARHCLRISRQGVSLLETGEFNVRVDDPQEYFDLTELPFDDMTDKLRKELDKIKTVDSVLPVETNQDKVSDFLLEVRRQNVGTSVRT
jgi:uncharacterized protein